MPYFCRSGHPEVSAEQFLDFIGHFLPQENVLDLPRITGRDREPANASVEKPTWETGDTKPPALAPLRASQAAETAAVDRTHLQHEGGLDLSCSCQKSYCWWSGWVGLE